MRYLMQKKFHLTLFLIFISVPTTTYALEILSLGDSITQGLQRTASRIIYGITSPVNGAANIGGYQPFLNASLDKYIEPSTVYNWGIAGETSRGGLMRIQNILNSRQTDYILILYGANDLNAGISASTTQANIRNMVRLSRVANVLPIISELSPYNFHTFRIENLYNPLLNELSIEENVNIVPMYQDMIVNWNSTPYHSGDGLHPNTNGYAVMSELWFRAIQQRVNDDVSIMPIILLLLK